MVDALTWQDSDTGHPSTTWQGYKIKLYEDGNSGRWRFSISVERSISGPYFSQEMYPTRREAFTECLAEIRRWGSQPPLPPLYES